MAPEASPFIYCYKRGGSSLEGREGGDWMFQKDSDGRKVGAGTSSMHQDPRKTN